MSGYCKIAPGHEFHGPYHDTEYGFPVEDESALAERDPDAATMANGRYITSTFAV